MDATIDGQRSSLWLKRELEIVAPHVYLELLEVGRRIHEIRDYRGNRKTLEFKVELEGGEQKWIADDVMFFFAERFEHVKPLHDRYSGLLDYNVYPGEFSDKQELPSEVDE